MVMTGDLICLSGEVTKNEQQAQQKEAGQKIRPHRFGGEGVLIGGQTATLNA